MCWTGNYAQLAEFCGFPEIGVLSLFYYRNGGMLDTPFFYNQSKLKSKKNSASSVSVLDVLLNESEDNYQEQNQLNFHCGCGIETCGRSPCFIPTRIINSNLTKELIYSLVRVDLHLKDLWKTGSESADDIIAEMTSKASLVSATDETDNDVNPCVGLKINEASQLSYLDESLRFWETQGVIDNSCKLRGNSNMMRPMSSILQVLLLKQLYCAPVGGSFLFLACKAVRHFSQTMTTSSKMGRFMAFQWKSHWAYYLLIQAVVLGKRMKKHRRNSIVPYHVPIWDIIHGINQRKLYGSADLQKQEIVKHEGTEDSNKRYNCNSDVAKLFNVLFTHLCKESCTNLPKVDPICLLRQSETHHKRKPLFLLGDSHVLSIAWQTLQIVRHNRMNEKNVGNTTEYFTHHTIVPFPITGLKAWHLRRSTKFFTYSNLRSSFQRLPSSCQTILLSAGEIDCREGIGGSLLCGYYKNCDDAVQNTVCEYVKSVNFLAEEYSLQILLLPIAPHAYRSEKNGRAKGRELRRTRITLWNNLLRKATFNLKINQKNLQRVFLLDYDAGLRSNRGNFLNNVYNADNTHLNSAFIPLLENSIVDCGCNFDLIS